VTGPHAVQPAAPFGRRLHLFQSVPVSHLPALVISFLVGPPIIRWLKRKQGEGQPIRADGPESHLISKAGTPTMGGFLILLALCTSTLLWADLTNGFVWAILYITIGFGTIGFADDILKLTRRSSKGLPSRFKLLAQFVIGTVAFLFVVFAVLVLVGSSNAVNLTDGLDGLAIVPVMIAAGCFALIAYLVGNSVYANYLQIHYVAGTGELAVFCGALIGASLGFLWFNAPPAMVFMGDTGRRPLRAGGGFGDRAGRLLQADRPPRVPHGAAAPSLREKRLGRAHHRDPLLDHRLDPGARRPLHLETAVRGRR
jgi:phospho-N-acetylmuramoyl-pentapeptide-transferase